MERDGAVRLERLFSKPLLERMRAAVAPRLERGEFRARGLVRDIGGRCATIVPFTGPMLDPRFYANDRLLGLVSALLGASHCIGSLEVVAAAPGSSAQHQHIDGPLRFDRVVGGRKKAYARDLSRLPPYAVSFAIPLCDVSEENGPTAIWPGSHRTALRPRPPSAAEVGRRYPEEHMTGKFGSAFMFDYRVYHGGTPNFTRETRPLLMFVFTRTWFRDPNLMDVDQSVVIAPKDYRRIPSRHRPLFALARAARRAVWAD
jgi:ectoine hydroxylase-related dioxygenase (phytanoyl-CoA dioxygenase family)